MSVHETDQGKVLAVGQVVRWHGKAWFGMSDRIMEGVISSNPTVKRGKTGYFVVVNNKRVFVPVDKMLKD